MCVSGSGRMGRPRARRARPPSRSAPPTAAGCTCAARSSPGRSGRPGRSRARTRRRGASSRSSGRGSARRSDSAARRSARTTAARPLLEHLRRRLDEVPLRRDSREGSQRCPPANIVWSRWPNSCRKVMTSECSISPRSPACLPAGCRRARLGDLDLRASLSDRELAGMVVLSGRGCRSRKKRPTSRWPSSSAASTLGCQTTASSMRL